MQKRKIDEVVEEQFYTKQQLQNADRYKHNKDLLNALLDESRKYSHKEVEDIIKGFLKKEVK